MNVDTTLRILFLGTALASVFDSLAASPALENDDLVILDVAQDGETFLELQSFPSPADPPDWRLRNDHGDLFLSVAGAQALKLDDTAPDGGFTLKGHFGEPRFGIGTDSPAGPFHMLLPGPAPLKLENSLTGVRWNLVNASNGVLSFNRKFSGGQEMTIRERLDAAGPTLEIEGSVRGTQFISSSSRRFKGDFRTIDPVEVLDRLLMLPLTTWRHTNGGSRARHIGPVAEDFQRLFDLGDGETISVVDADGVSMAAIQGLNAKVESLEAALQVRDAEVVALRRANVELQQRLAEIEARLEQDAP